MCYARLGYCCCFPVWSAHSYKNGRYLYAYRYSLASPLSLSISATYVLTYTKLILQTIIICSCYTRRTWQMLGKYNLNQWRCERAYVLDSQCTFHILSCIMHTFAVDTLTCIHGARLINPLKHFSSISYDTKVIRRIFDLRSQKFRYRKCSFQWWNDRAVCTSMNVLSELGMTKENWI